MASTYSTNLAIELIGTGDQAGTWGTTTNSNLGTLIEQSISGYVTQAVSTGTDTTITIPNGSSGVARNMYIELTGTGGSNTNLVVPANKKLYFIFNNSTGAVTVKVSAQTGVSVPTGKKMVLVSNGTDIVNGLNYIADFATNSFTVTNLTASSGTITNLLATSGSITNLVSSDASATVLRAGSATLTHLSATSATITNLTLTSLVISNLSIASANITTLTSASATITNLLATSLAVSSIATFAAGSAAAPSITTTGDTNTGIFFPAADTIAFTEGGVEAMRINSSGSMGLGTTSDLLAQQGNLALNGASGTGNGAVLGIAQNGSIIGGIGQYSRITGSGTSQDIFIQSQGSTNNVGINANPASAYIYFQTQGTERMRLDSSGNLGIGTSSPSDRLHVKGVLRIEDSTDTTTRDYQLKVDTTGGLAFIDTVGPTTKMFLDFAGNLGVGTTSPGQKLEVAGNILVNTSGNPYAEIKTSGSGNNPYLKLTADTNSWTFQGTFSNANDDLLVLYNATTLLDLDKNGNLGLGVTPSAWTTFTSALEVPGGALAGISANQLDVWQNCFYNSSSFKYISTAGATLYQQAGSSHTWFNAPSGTAGNTISFTQAMTLNASGQLGIGTTSPTAKVHIEGADGSSFLRIQRASTNIFGTINQSSETNALGLAFNANDGNAFTPGFVWRTGTDGSTFTERMRLSGGDLLVGQTTNALADTGHILDGDGIAYHITNGITCLAVNRKTSDGTLVDFLQDGVSEGTISVSGTTVSYNGGHLSRYSQTTDDTRIPLVKGTVMSNLDQMAVWEKDGQPLPNEQLNCMKVSDVEGDVNVAGVFVNWDNDDDVYTNDMNIAMTGDMIIRIAQGVTVQRGDLLMSAGDGTAKPQGDDIIRSKTVAKVTSNHVTCTYEDGSYCVPCVLMAC